jgi:hypothetical protein
LLHGAAIQKSAQSNGLGKKSIEIILRKCKKKYIAFTTQNPVMYESVKKFCYITHPSPTNRYIPTEIKEIGMQLMEHRRGNFDSTTFITTNLYSECLYAKIPCSRNTDVNLWFEKKLGMKNRRTRNGFLFLGKLKH